MEPYPRHKPASALENNFKMTLQEPVNLLESDAEFKNLVTVNLVYDEPSPLVYFLPNVAVEEFTFADVADYYSQVRVVQQVDWTVPGSDALALGYSDAPIPGSEALVLGYSDAPRPWL